MYGYNMDERIFVSKEILVWNSKQKNNACELGTRIAEEVNSEIKTSTNSWDR